MIKKVLISAFISSFVSISAIAGTNIGIKGSYGDMSATGSHTTNSTTAGSLGSGGAAVSASGDANFPVGSIFVEKEFELSQFNIAVGLDYIPYDSQIDKLDGGDGFDATLHIGNVGTLYVQPRFSVNDNVSLFLKAGYTNANLDITEISRQATATETTDSASTDGVQEKSLKGPVYGVGAQVSFSDSFLRFEYTNTDFDEIIHTNSNGKVLKADSDVNMASISFGRSF